MAQSQNIIHNAISNFHQGIPYGYFQKCMIYYEARILFFCVRDSFIPVLSVSLKGRNSIRYHVEEVINME